MTPLLTSKLAGQFVAVDPMGLFMSTVQVLRQLIHSASLACFWNSFSTTKSKKFQRLGTAFAATRSNWDEF